MWEESARGGRRERERENWATRRPAARQDGDNLLLASCFHHLHTPSSTFQVAAWEPTLQKIAGWFDQLQAVDVEGVPPATDAGVGGSSLRADEVDVSLAGAEEALGQVPERVDGYVRVPKV